MAVSDKGVEKRPTQSVAETRVGDVNPDIVPEVGQVADGVDDDTRDRVIYATTTRERTVNAKRAHEPLDPRLADEGQPDEENNGPRAAEIGGSAGPTEAVSKVGVSEAQLKAGAEALEGTGVGSEEPKSRSSK